MMNKSTNVIESFLKLHVFIKDFFLTITVKVRTFVADLFVPAIMTAYNDRLNKGIGRCLY